MSNPKKEKIEAIKSEVSEFHPILDILLRKLPGVVDVEHTHGNAEMGADFVFSKTHELLGHEEYVGVVAKIGKITQDFVDLERQIDECTVPRNFRGGKQKIRIDEVWVITNDTISKNAQEKIFEKYKSTSISFIPGEKLINLLDTYYPAFWTDTTLQIGEYLSTVRARNEEIDRQLSLIQLTDQGFYIEQDLYEFPRYEFRKLLKSKNKRPAKVNLLNEIQEHNFVLIEGGVGSGKSKLLRYLVNHFSIPNVFEKTKIIPVYTSYKELSETFGLSFQAVLENKLSIKLREELAQENVRYLILVDAFDETNINVEEQIEELSRILEALKTTPNIKVVITSRYISELDQTNILENEIARFNLAPLSLNRTLEFVKTLCKNLNIASRLIEDLKKSQLFKEMPRSPIAAILLAKLINENPKDIPSSLSELYAQYIEQILGRWEVDKGLQTQKEYQAFDNILIEYAKYIMDYEMIVISAGDAKFMVKQYLDERNLDLDAEELFKKLITRCEIVAVDRHTGNINFKHRSFAEFFYAKHSTKPNVEFKIEDKAFTIYWMNTVFFYLGILKDAPQLIEKLSVLEPETEGERWLKLINMANYMLAAYATPYSVISEATTNALMHASKLFSDIVSNKIDSPISKFPHMQFLQLMQLIVRDSYSFEFFRQALEDSVVRIDDSDISDSLKAYAMYFLNVTYIELGASESFDILLKKYADALPMDISLAIHHESLDFKTRTDLMRRQDRKIRHLIKDNSPLKHELKILYETPIKLLPASTGEVTKPIPKKAASK